MKIEPQCRYGHGELTLSPELWSLAGMTATQMTCNSDCDDSLDDVAMNGRAFTVLVYRCECCGYIELFDDAEVKNGD